MDLSDYRKQIDGIDAQMIALFEQRMELVRLVAQYKKEHQLPVLQAEREQQVLKKAQAYLKKQEYAQDAVQFMKAVMEISRACQHRDLQRTLYPPKAEHLEVGRVGYQHAI